MKRSVGYTVFMTSDWWNKVDRSTTYIFKLRFVSDIQRTILNAQLGLKACFQLTTEKKTDQFITVVTKDVVWLV